MSYIGTVTIAKYTFTYYGGGFSGEEGIIISEDSIALFDDPVFSSELKTAIQLQPYLHWESECDDIPYGWEYFKDHNISRNLEYANGALIALEKCKDIYGFEISQEKYDFVVFSIDYLKRRLIKESKKEEMRAFHILRPIIFSRDNEQCQYCAKVFLPTESYSIDHIKPRSKGGNNSTENLVTACKSCNSKKGNRSLEEANMTLLKQ